MPTLASLVVDLQVQSAPLQSGLDDAAKKLSEFAARADGLVKGLAQGFALEMVKDAVVKLGDFVAHGAEVADQMGKLAQSAGVPVEAFSRLAYAANLSDVSTEDLGSSMSKLDKTMASAFSGADKGAAAAFKALNVQITDTSGKMKTSEEVMLQVADRFAGLEDGAAKTALAQQLFGKSGAELIPLLNQGADGIWDMEAAADQFGVTVTAAGAASAEQFNDSLTKLKKIGEGVAIRVAADLTPSLSKLADQLIGTATKGDTLNEAAKVLANTLRVLVSAGAVVAGIFEAVGKVIGAAAAAVVQVMDGDFKGAKETMKLLGDDLAEVASSTTDHLKAIWSNEDKGVAGGMKQQEKPVKRSADRMVQHIEQVKKAFTEQEEIAKRMADAVPKALAEVQKAGVEAEGLVAEKRRANAQANGPFFGAGPDTRGFASFEAALEALNAATVNEAHMKQQATLAEISKDREGQLVALQMEEQFKRAAAEAGKAADAFTEIDAAARDAQKSMLAKAIGPVQGLINAGVQGATAGAAAGPEGAAIGAAVGVGLDLLTQSKQFQELMDLVGQTIQDVANALGGLLEPLLPFAQLVEAFTFALTSIIGPIFKALEPVFKFLYDIFRGFALAVLNIEEFIVSIINGIAHLFGGKGIDDSGIKAGIDKLTSANYGAAESTEKLGKAAETATEEILNAPAGFKGLALARWSAADMDQGPPGAGSGGGTGGGSGGDGGGWTAPSLGGGGGGGPNSGGGIGRGPGGGQRMNLTGSAPVVEVHVNADLERYVKVQSRNRSYAAAGSSQPLSLAFDY
jgi:hypothetical protein